MSETQKIDDGGPAFPCEGGDMSGLHAAPGMSLRDWFAGQVLAALVGAFNSPGNDEIRRIVMRSAEEDGETIHDHAAGSAYAYADAMLAIRKRVPNG